MKNSLSHILLWSVISAAFIGPGTITSASKAGHGFGFDLMWALLFSIIATVVLQEASVRIKMATDKNLGEVLGLIRFPKAFSFILFIAVSLGCAAYEAGNVLGAVAGLELSVDTNKSLLSVLTILLAFIVLIQGSVKRICQLLGIIVGVMGLAFMIIALQVNFDWGALARGLFIPNVPDQSSLMIIALVGTTIVPYNLFLANGIKHNQNLQEMRFGLTFAILFGGIISFAILILGTSISGVFGFKTLQTAFEQQSITGGGHLFSLGLFCAGLSSAITAPLAAALAGESLFGKHERWKKHHFNMIWMGILGFGAIIALLDFKPIPIIILAQAVNGILLPFIAITILWVINYPKLMKVEYRNSLGINLLSLAIIGCCIFLGMINILKATNSASGLLIQENSMINYALFTASILTFILGLLIFRKKD